MSVRSPARTPGLTLVEVLVSMAVLGIVASSLVALQVGSLRASRTARDLRELAAAADYQLGLARLLPATAACRDLANWPMVSACQVSIDCLDAACALRVVNVRVESAAGRSSEWRTAAFIGLERAPRATPSGGAAP